MKYQIAALALIASSAFAEGVETFEPPCTVSVDTATANQAFQDYRHTLVTELAKSDNPRKLLAAALLAQPANIAPLPTPLQYRSLLQRAQHFGTDDPMVWWISALQPGCDPVDASCSNQAEVKQLLAVDPDNAAAWLLELTRADKDPNSSSAKEALKHAAQANRFDDYYSTTLKMMLNVLLDDPALPANAAVACLDGLTDAAAKKLSALNMAHVIVSAAALPAYQMLMKWCDAKNAQVPQADCLAVGEKIKDGNSSFISLGIGLRMREKLLADSRQTQALRQERRNHDWLLQQSARIGESITKNSDGIERFIKATLDSHSEAETWRTLMTQQEITLQPPDVWQPAHRE